MNREGRGAEKYPPFTVGASAFSKGNNGGLSPVLTMLVTFHRHPRHVSNAQMDQYRLETKIDFVVVVVDVVVTLNQGNFCFFSLTSKARDATATSQSSVLHIFFI